jgi:hypothetical protein
MTKPTLSITCLLAGLLLGVSAFAGSFTSDFSNPAQPGFKLTGGVRPNGDPYPAFIKDATGNDCLALTFAEASEQGTILLDDLDAGATVGSFKLSVKLRIGGGTSTPADGMAFYFGAAPLDGVTFGEEGPEGTDPGVVVCIDTYDNVDGDPVTPGGEAPAIDVKVNGTTVATKMVDVFFPLSDTFVPLNIELKDNGTLSVDYKGTVVYTNLVLVGYAPIAGGRFAIGARTGEANENNWIDDLSITTTLAGAPTGPSIVEQPQSQTINEYGSVTFSVIPGGTPPFTFLWACDKTTLTDATNPTLTLNNVSANLNGAKFHVTVSNAQGSVTSDDAILTVNADTVPPALSLVSGSQTFNSATVIFSEPVNITGATFALSGGLSISGRTQPSPTTVVLATSAQTPGATYTLTVNGVKDLAAVPNTIAADSKMDFIAWSLIMGFLREEYWGGINTAPGTVDDLLNDARYQANTPDAINYATAFDSRTFFPNDLHEYYGDRLTGFIIPQETADYYFFLRSDDASQLWLSTDADPANATMIAEETGCCNAFLEPGAAQTSWLIHLEAGQRYAVMALHKEGTGGDYIQVAWRKDGDTTPAAQLPPIPGEYLAVYADPTPAVINITEQPASVTAGENKTATFSVAATGAPAPVAYQWQRANPGSATFANIHGAIAASYTTPILKKALDDGAKYRVLVSVPGKTVPSTEAALTVEIDTTPPALVRVAAGVDLRSLYLVFSEAVDPASVTAAGNYNIPGLTVTGAKLAGADRVMVITSKQAEDTSYAVTVTGVTDTAIPANPIDPAANSGSFTSPVLVPSAMAWEIWTGLRTDTVAIPELTGDARYPLDPSLVKLTPGYEGPGFGDGYGARLRGFITPKTTGDYVFYMASDDNGELWLSTDDSAANVALIAREPSWGNLREWTGEAGGGGRCDAGPCLNVSEPIHLVAGQAYYTELLWKEGGGGDHGEVTWKLESAADPENGSPPIWGDVLSTAVPKSMLPVISLPVSLASPLGSGDAAKPGFTARVYQANQDGATVSVNQTSRAEQELLGLLGPNVADLTGAVDGAFTIAGTINWNQEMGAGGTGAEIGNFQSGSTPSRPDEPIPGIPGVGSNTARNTDNIAAEIITYAEFPQTGAYMMGVNSDDGFKVTATDQRPANVRAVRVHPPSSAAGSYYAADSGPAYGGVFKAITGPITGKLVLTDPDTACSDLNNAAALQGNIALMYRGVCYFSDKCTRAKAAGAIAAIIVNSRDPGSADGPWPIIMGGYYVDIPCVMMCKPDGNKIRAALAAGEEVIVDITPDDIPALGEFDGGRGSSDSYFPLYVAQAGVYPLRLVWYEGEGGANVEWFTFDSAGNKALLNDRTVASAIKTYRARTYVPPQPTISISQSGANVVLTFTGTLQSADKVTGPWSDVAGATSPKTVPVSQAAMKFYRAKAP